MLHMKRSNCWKPNLIHGLLLKMLMICTKELGSQNHSLAWRAQQSNELRSSHEVYHWTEDLSFTIVEAGFGMRPHIVWFGEAVPMLESAAAQILDADIVLWYWLFHAGLSSSWVSSLCTQRCRSDLYWPKTKFLTNLVFVKSSPSYPNPGLLKAWLIFKIIPSRVRFVNYLWNKRLSWEKMYVTF